MKLGRETLFCGIWATFTAAVGLWIGDAAGALWLAVGSAFFLLGFMFTWRAAGFWRAALSYAVPAGMLVAGSLVFSYVSRVAGGAILILAGPAWIWMTYWAFMTSRKTIAGGWRVPDEEDFIWDERPEDTSIWDARHEATLPMLPGVSVSAPNWDGMFSGINTPGRREAVNPWSESRSGHQD